MKFVFFVSCFLWLFGWQMPVEGQEKLERGRGAMRKGNALFEEKPNEAVAAYRKAMEVAPESKMVKYNLGTALVKTGEMEEARNLLAKVAAGQGSALQRGHALHNLGNSFMEEQDYGKAIDAYKQSLKLNPQDDETRYNLAYAMLKQQENEQQQQDQQQDQQNKDEENKDEQQQNQDQQQNEEDQQQDQQQQDKQDEQQNKQQQEQQAQPQQEMSKENMERILDALRRQEEEVKEDMEKKKVGRPQHSEKNW